ncbi:Protein RGF1 INDUCIBLE TRANSCRIPTION FACTOR 1 [Linum grandiflorum]
MVNPIDSMATGGQRDLVPAWVKPMLKANYFLPCDVHGDSTKSECNLFCLDCSGNALCSYCLINHRDHRVVQIRRSSYHNVVRVNEIQKHLDISGVQTYVINSAKILFLNERPQSRPGKGGVGSTCEICCRSLPDSFRFCSLGCKLRGVKQGGDESAAFTLGEKHKGYDSDDSSTPQKMQRTNLFSPIMDRFSTHYPDSSGNDVSPATPPMSNHSNARRRKGIPHRAPF